MAIPSDWWRLDAAGQAEAVRHGELTPSELVDAALARIEAVNPAINAVITPLPEVAHRFVAALPQFDQPFRGVPILLKDGGEELEDTPYSLGTSVLRDSGYRSARTTELVRRLLDAGFIPVGKTNLPQLASGFTTEPEAFGPTRNPWDVTRTAGGSSGGSAAAVAAGLVSIALGGDATGSLRVPAACCGVATLKPSRGLVPSATPADQPDLNGVWANFVLTRSIRDMAGVLEVVADIGAAPDADLPALRIGLLTHDPGSALEVHRDVVAAVEQAGWLLRARGHSVEAARPEALDDLFTPLADALALSGAFARAAQLRWLETAAGRPLREGDLRRELLERGARDAGVTAAEAEQAAATIADRVAPVLDWWLQHDVLVTPTIRQPAWPLGAADGVANTGMFTFPFSFTGQPALTVPLAMSEEGLPVSVQLVGRIGADRDLFELGAQLEADAPWSDRWPPLAEADS